MSNFRDSRQKFSVAAYAWLMFITDYYRRVSDLDLNFDEMMTLNTVVTQWLYKVNTQDPKSRKEITDMTDFEIGKYFQGSRLSVLSIANILNQPKESVRRRVQKLIDNPAHVKKMSLNSREISKLHDWKIIVKNLLKMINENGF